MMTTRHFHSFEQIFVPDVYCFRAQRFGIDVFRLSPVAQVFPYAHEHTEADNLKDCRSDG